MKLFWNGNVGGDRAGRRTRRLGVNPLLYFAWNELTCRRYLCIGGKIVSWRRR